MSEWVFGERYYAFLVRFWQDDNDAPWRGLVVHVDTGERRSFASPERLFVYLLEQMETAVAPHYQVDTTNLDNKESLL
jgi:hypothetical protein